VPYQRGGDWGQDINLKITILLLNNINIKGLYIKGVFLKIAGSYEKVNFPVSFRPNFIHSGASRNEIEVFKKICTSALSVSILR
jgi:hypothetical protein